MKRIALLDGTGKCQTVALWDGVTAWNPVAAGLCASTQDVTATPQVGPGWTYASSAWSAPPPPAPLPNPSGFVTAVASDSTLAGPTRLAAVNALASLMAAVESGQTPLITAVWDLMIGVHGISSSDQAAVHAHAVANAIPGI